MATNETEVRETVIVPVQDAHVVMRVIEDANEEQLLCGLTVTREDDSSSVTIALTRSELNKLLKEGHAIAELIDE